MKTTSLRKDLKRVFLPFWFGSDRWRGFGWMATLLLFLIAIGFINIAISYSERAVFNSLEVKNAVDFWRNLFIYAGVLVASVPVVGCFGWIKMKLEMTWRRWLTTFIMDRYLAKRNFVRIRAKDVANPDERLQQDVQDFCTEVLTIAMALLDSLVAFVSFVAILYFISPVLLIVALGYSLIGTIATLVFGKRLIGLHYEQKTREADFRYNLVYLRDNAEAIGLYNGAERERKGLVGRLTSLLANLNHIASWQRNMTLFKVSYDYSLLIVPALISAPLYLSGQIELGAMVQAGTSFGRVIGALSVFIAQYQGFARLTAITRRLSDFIGGLEELEAEDGQPQPIEMRIGDTLAIENLTLVTPGDKRTLLRDLNFALSPGTKVLVDGPSGVGKSTLLRAISGLWSQGQGSITRPQLGRMLVLPQFPYMPLGTLREQLTYPLTAEEAAKISDAQLQENLDKVNFGDLIERYRDEGGLNAVKVWPEVLSPGERQRITFARLLLAHPSLLILDEATSALDVDSEKLLYGIATARGASVVSVGHHRSLIAVHDQVLEIIPGGTWRIVDAAQYAEEKTEPCQDHGHGEGQPQDKS